MSLVHFPALPSSWKLTGNSAIRDFLQNEIVNVKKKKKFFYSKKNNFLTILHF